jgi:hypothetical protein
MHKAGFKNIQSDVRDAPAYMAVAMHDCNLVIHELISRKTHNTEASQAIQRLMPEVAHETRAGSFWAFTRWTVIGKKQ